MLKLYFSSKDLYLNASYTKSHMFSQFWPTTDRKMLLQYDCGLSSVENSAVQSCEGVLCNSFVSRLLSFSIEDEYLHREAYD